MRLASTSVVVALSAALAAVGFACGGSVEAGPGEVTGSAILDAADGGALRETGPDGDAGLETGSNSDARPDGLASCPELPGPAMVLSPQGYCIDSTEVTHEQYTAWLTTNPSIEGQPERCGWNTAFEPEPDCWEATLVNAKCSSPGCEQLPQPCVDRCDAVAYCKAVGKRLCGKVGGGEIQVADFGDATKSQWYNACSSGGQHPYPYGDSYEADRCNGKDPAAPEFGLAEVASYPQCQSSETGYTGVYDLSGNEGEWVDTECVPNTTGVLDGSIDYCYVPAGSLGTTDEALACAMLTTTGRNARLGVRCCFP